LQLIALQRCRWTRRPHRHGRALTDPVGYAASVGYRQSMVGYRGLFVFGSNVAIETRRDLPRGAREGRGPRAPSQILVGSTESFIQGVGQGPVASEEQAHLQEPHQPDRGRRSATPIRQLRCSRCVGVHGRGREDRRAEYVRSLRSHL
jgi:hypothetical protein